MKLEPPPVRPARRGPRRLPSLGGGAEASSLALARAARPLSRRRRLRRSGARQRHSVDAPTLPVGRRRDPARSRSPRTRASAASSRPRRRSSRRRRTGPAGCSSRASGRRASTGTASPMPRGMAAGSAGRSPRRADNDPRPVKFAFVSCQNINEGLLNAYRRMIYEDERAARAEQLGFVLHLGDFIYEVVEYPEDVQTRYDRTIYDVGRIPDGEKVGNFHIPPDRRRLSRRLSRLSRRSGPAGCPRPLAVRGDVGQSRILLAGLAEHPEGAAGSSAPGADPQGRRQPGLVRISAGAGDQGERPRLDRFDPPASCR